MTSESNPEALDECKTLLASSAELLAVTGRCPPESALLTHLRRVSTSSLRRLHFFLCLEPSPEEVLNETMGWVSPCLWRQTTLQGLKGKDRNGCYSCTQMTPNLSWLDSLFLTVLFLRFPRGARGRQTAELFSTRNAFRLGPDSPMQKVVGRERLWDQSEKEGAAAKRSQTWVPSTVCCSSEQPSLWSRHLHWRGAICLWLNFLLATVHQVESASWGTDTPQQREACTSRVWGSLISRGKFSATLGFKESLSRSLRGRRQ